MDRQLIDLPETAVIGRAGLCTKENNLVPALWAEANARFGEVAPLARRNPDGTLAGFWGAMSDPGMRFLPWEDGLTRGYYLAGVETQPDAAAPAGWTKWILPARRCLSVRVPPGCYGEVLHGILRELPEMGLRLSGAVCDFTVPSTGENRLLFPVEKG